MLKASIVVPAFGQQASLDRSLATLHGQPYHEVIVVDDGSPEPLRVPEWCRLVLVQRSPVHRGSSAAKNHGASLATGDLLIFADSDILHMPDAVESIVECYNDWGSDKLLLNTCRVSLPQHYPDSWIKSMDELYDKCELAGTVRDPDMVMDVVCWEQNFGAISREYFNRLGGYDAKSFPSWGYNNQDLDVRVTLDGGHVSSSIPRSSNGKRLHCFHIWHENGCDIPRAKNEWLAKWDVEFSTDMVHNMRAQAYLGRADKYQSRIYLRAA